MNRIISRECKEKLEELIRISKLPINYNGSSLTFSCFPFSIIDNQYVYKDANEVLIIEIEHDYVSLTHVKNNSLLYLYSRTDDSELKVIREAENHSSYVDLNNEGMKVILSNTLTFEVESILKRYRIKANIKKSSNLEHTELSFKLPVFIEAGRDNLDLNQYIPESRLLIIRGHEGKKLETYGAHQRKYYCEESFKVAPSLISSNILPHFKEIVRVKEVDTVINPYVTSSISTSLIPLRSSITRDLYKKVFTDEKNEELYKAYVRCFDDAVYGITYFQNEANKNFYVFEDDLKKLQYK